MTYHLVSAKKAVSRRMNEKLYCDKTAGFGVAICDHADNLLYAMKESVLLSEYRKEVEIKALIHGLTQAFDLEIRHVRIYCDDYQIFQFINGGARPRQYKIVQLVEEVRRVRAKMASCEPLMVARNDVKFAFKLAREALLSQSSSTTVDAQGKETCVVCLEETNAESMFFTDQCLHRHCFSCVKQFVEVKLLSGNVPTCLAYGCNLELTLESCTRFLTARVIDMWKQKMREDSIPVAERIYCPYQSCSMLMSKAELLRSGDASEPDQSNVRACVKCCGLFCIDCKVPSHTDLSCADYKRLHPDPLVEDMELNSLANDNKWRQCVKCRHLIERAQGCNHMTCRCGYEFCYKCGTEWEKNQQKCPSGCVLEGQGDDYDDSDDDNDSEHTCETDMCQCYYDPEGVRWRNFEEFIDHQPHVDMPPEFVEGVQEYEQFLDGEVYDDGSDYDYNFGGLTPEDVGGFDEAFYMDYYSL